jgi:hypothetical protein
LVPDIGLSVRVSRELLGLGELEINDHRSYYCAPQFLGGQVAWRRNTVSSPWLDGDVTINRTRGMVTEQLAVEVLGANLSEAQTNVVTLIEAFIQSRFTLTADFGDLEVSQVYDCEAADYQISWSGPRLVASQLQVVLGVPRQPVALAGGF